MSEPSHEPIYGLSAPVIDSLRQVLASYREVDQAILYGSRAMGTFRPASDIDLTLIGPKLTPRLMAQIDAALDDLLLPYMIDLSSLASINHGPLLDHIQRVGVVLYSRELGGRTSGGQDAESMNLQGDMKALP